MKRLALVFLILSVFFFSSALEARNPPPLFNRPVKLDDTGRPLYNSWEQQEHLRKQKFEHRQPPPARPNMVGMPTHTTGMPPHAPKGLPGSDEDKKYNSVTSQPSPSQPVINRPTKVIGDGTEMGTGDEFTF